MHVQLRVMSTSSLCALSLCPPACLTKYLTTTRKLKHGGLLYAVTSGRCSHHSLSPLRSSSKLRRVLKVQMFASFRDNSCVFRSDSCFRRGFSSKSGVHVENRPSNVDEISEGIYEKIVFSNANIVAVNKPYGLSVFGSSSDGTRKSTDDIGKNSDHLPCIASSLPWLKDKLKCSYLSIGLSLKSFYSGIILLCKSKQSQENLQRVLAGGGPQKLEFMTYLAITVGVPRCSHGVSSLVGIKREWLHNKEMSTLSEKISTEGCKEGQMIRSCFTVSPLAVNEDTGAALVQVTVNKDRWDAVQVLLSHYLSPVLGDLVYASRTSMVGQVPFPIGPHAAIPGTQMLPPKLVESLYSNMAFTQDKPLPVFLHRHKVVLNKSPKSSTSPLVISAPPHKEFLTALQCLGLYREGMFS